MWNLVMIWQTKTAQNWHYGLEMKEQEKTLKFLRFVINKVKQSPLYAGN